jgi:hypothetical protein
MDQAGRFVADTVLGIDTLWGGDVMCPSGTGRFIADSWFSDEPLPDAYTTPAAARLRETGGVGGKTIDRAAAEAYLREVDLPKAMDGMCIEAEKIGGLRGHYLAGLAFSLRTMWELAMEMLGEGKPVSYERCVQASTAKLPEPSLQERRLAECRGRLASRSHYTDGLSQGSRRGSDLILR